MDPLSVTASVIAVLQLTATVVNFLNNVKNASESQKQCAIEASNIFALLTSLKYRLEEATPADPWYARVRALAVEKGPLSQYRAALERLAAKILPRDGVPKVVAALLWPFNKEEVSEMFTTIERLKSLVSIALEMDHFKLSQAIKNETQHIPGLARDLGAIRCKQDDQQSRTIIHWVSTIDFANQQTDFSLKRQAGTGTWFLESPVFVNWLNGLNTTLFCPGIPGAGKTMLSSLVIDHLRKVGYQRGAGLAYLYCNYKKYEEQRAIDFLSAILKQLVEGLPSVPDAVEALYYKHERLKSRPSFDDISVTIRSVCDCYPEVFIVIDALDECLDEHRNALLSKLKILQASNSNVRLMVTSRPIITIIQAFENAACLTIAAHEKDVKQFVEGQIPRLARCVSREPDLKQLVISSINNAADGMFLLARLLLDSLVDKTTPKAIKSALESLEKGPEALSQAYKGAIDRIENQAPGHHSLAKQVLSWISCARRPLSLKELQHALATEIGERQFDDENITDISDIVSVCAGLVTVDGQSDVVRLVHKTTQEYFDKMWTSIFPTAHEDIAMTCVSYLSFDAFETGACQDRMAFTARLESYALYDYAARNWGYHARTASIEKEELILDFLKSEAKVSASAELIISSEFLWSRFYSRVPSKITGMHLSAYFGLGDTMTALLEIGYSLCLQDTEGRNPLFYAAGNGQDGVIAQFLDTNYVHSGSQDKLGRTILFYAARYGREAVVKSLLTRDDIDINLRSYNGVSPLSYAAEHGHESVVKLLLAVDGVDPNSKDYRERTPLSCAAKNGHEAVVKLLLGNDGVDPNSRDLEGCTPLLYASWIHTATVRLLLGKDGVDPDPEDMNGQTPLSRAASFGLEEAVELFLATKGVNPNSRDKKGRTPLSHAAGNGKNGVVKLLLADGRVDPDSRDANGRTPLSYAAGNEHEFGQKEVVELLLAEARVDPDSKDADGRTPLSYAVRRRRHGAIEVIQVLLTEARIDPDSKDANGRTPLSHAAEMGRRRAVKMLLANERIDPNTKDVDGRTPLSHAMKRGYRDTEVVQILLKEGRIDPDTRDTHDRTPLSHAAEHGGTGSVKLLLAEGLIAPDSKDINGRTPLSYAAEMGRRETVRMLLADDRIDPDSKDANSYTPLSYAAEKGHIEVVKLLLQKTTFSKTLQMSGQTLFSWAAETWYNGIVRGLTVWDEIPVDLTSREIRKLSIAEEKYVGIAEALFEDDSHNTFSDGKSTLAAVRNWHEAVVRLLLASKRKAEKMKQQPDADMRCEMMVELFLASEGVNPDLRDAFGRTLLWWAARNGYEAVVRLLLAKEGVDPESRDDDGRTSLLYAAKNGHEVIVKLLLMRGVDPNAKDKYGLTPLMLAAWQGHESVAKLLLAGPCVEPNSKDADGREQLSHVAENVLEMTRELLSARDETESDSEIIHGLTPLSLAAQQGHEGVIKLLLAKGDVNLNLEVGEYRQTPLHLAALGGHHGIVNLLLAEDGIIPDPKDSRNQTPLWAAACAGHEAVVKLLLAAGGVDLNSKDNTDGRTPLSVAAYNGHHAVVKLLLGQDDIDPDPKDTRYGMTPLSWAAEWGHVAVVELLVAKDSVDLDSRDTRGRTALSWAAGNGHVAVVKLLAAKDGVDLDSRDAEGRTPLSWAAGNGHVAVVELLDAKHRINGCAKR